ncbi:MAG: AbiV family abortive infection protein [Vicinamibacterales bacterium]
MNRKAVTEGAVRALANSVSQLEAAASLFEQGRDAPALVLAVSGREELGRFVLLYKKAASMLDDQVVDPRQLRKSLDDHEAKLRAGQTSYPVWLKPDLLDSWRDAIATNDTAELTRLQPQLDAAKDAVRRREPQDAHQRRLRAQYVDPQPDGSWSDPSLVSADDSRVAIMTTAAGIANTLLGLQADPIVAASEPGAVLPNMGVFTTIVFGKLASRGT